MFRSATSFQGRGIEHFDTSQSRFFGVMFYGAANFNGDVSNFVLGDNVDSLYEMFREASSFNGNLGSWNTAGITNMDGLFRHAIAFEAQGLEEWNVSSVKRWEDTFLDTPSISGCTKKKIYDSWSA